MSTAGVQHLLRGLLSLALWAFTGLLALQAVGLWFTVIVDGATPARALVATVETVLVVVLSLTARALGRAGQPSDDGAAAARRRDALAR